MMGRKGLSLAALLVMGAFAVPAATSAHAGSRDVAAPSALTGLAKKKPKPQPSGSRILVMTCGYDPSGTKVTSVTLTDYSSRPGVAPKSIASFSIGASYNDGSYDVAPPFACGAGTAEFGGDHFIGASSLRRQLFDPTFSKLAVSISKSDGSHHVGYVDRGGRLHDLTPSPNGNFAASHNEANPIFQPGTGDIIVENNDNYPPQLIAITSGGSRHPFPDSRVGTDTSGQSGLIFDSSGNHSTSLVYADEDTYGPQFPGDVPVLTTTGPFAFSPAADQAFASIDTSHGFYGNNCDSTVLVQPSGQLFSDTPCLDVPNPCAPNAWVGNNRILCTDGGMAYLLTLGGQPGSASQKALLPDIGRRVWDPAASPDQTSFAFLSNGGGHPTQLWVAPLSGGTPVVVATPPASQVATIVDWHA